MYYIWVVIDVYVIYEVVCLIVEFSFMEDVVIRGCFISVWLIDFGIIISKSMS